MTQPEAVPDDQPQWTEQTPSQRLAEILNEARARGCQPDDLPGSFDPGRPFALVEENVHGDEPPAWITCHASVADAWRYHTTQEYASDWAIAELVNLATGESYDPGEVIEAGQAETVEAARLAAAARDLKVYGELADPSEDSGSIARYLETMAEEYEQQAAQLGGGPFLWERRQAKAEAYRDALRVVELSTARLWPTPDDR
ncbi:MAG: hypothetical protein AB7G37_06405 [Solirubrobacteraceae bacterium]